VKKTYVTKSNGCEALESHVG